MSELRQAKLVIEVAGNAMKDLKQIRAAVIELEKKGIQIKSSANLKDANADLKSTHSNAKAPATAYDQLSSASARLTNETKTSAKALSDLNKSRAEGYSAFGIWAADKMRDVANSISPSYSMAARALHATSAKTWEAARGSKKTAELERQNAILDEYLKKIEGAKSVEEVDALEKQLKEDLDAVSASTQKAGTSTKTLTGLLLQHRTALLATTAALTGYITFTGVMAMGINQSREELIRYAEAKGWDTDATRAWLEEESKVYGMSQRTKAAIANSVRDYATGVDQVKQFTETINAYWEVHQDRIGMSREAFAAAIGSGSIEQFTGLLQLDPFAVNAEWNQAAEEVQARLGYYNEEEIRKWAKTRAALRKMGVEADTPEFKKALESVKPGWDDFLSTLQDVNSNIGYALVPYLMRVVNWLREIGKIFNSIPLVSEFVAAGLAVGTIVVGLAAVVAVLSGVVLGTKLYVAALEAAGVKAIAIRGFTLAWYAAQLLLNGAMALFGIISAATGLPVLVIVFIALAAAVALVAYKMGWLNGLFEALGGLDIGNILSGGLDYAIGLWTELTGAVGGALDAISKAGGGGLFKMLLMAAFPPALLLKLLEPLVKPLEDLLGIDYDTNNILSFIYKLWKEFVGWLQNGWKLIADLVKYVTGFRAEEADRTLYRDLVAAVNGLNPFDVPLPDIGKAVISATGASINPLDNPVVKGVLDKASSLNPFNQPGGGSVPASSGGPPPADSPSPNTPALTDIIDWRLDPAGRARQLGLDPNATYTNENSGLQESGAALAARFDQLRLPSEYLANWKNDATGEPAGGSSNPPPTKSDSSDKSNPAPNKAKSEDEDVPVTSISGNDWSIGNSLKTSYEGAKDTVGSAVEGAKSYLGLSSGGEISSSGGIEIHKGEEVIPPAEAKTGPGAIARAIEALKAQQLHPTVLPPVNVTVNVYYPQLTNQTAVTQMKFDLDRQIKDTVARAMRFYTR